MPWPKNWIASILSPVLSRSDVSRCSRYESVLVNSDYSAEQVREIYGLKAGQCRTVYLGVDHDRFSPPAMPTPRTMMVTVVAKLTQFKNEDRVIDACALLVREGGSEMRLNIVGDGDATDGLRRHAERLGIARHVVFHGRATDEALVDLLQRSRAFCLASVGEPFGLVTIEALACGTPVVAIDSGGPREVLRDQDCGVLVDSPDPKKIAAGLAQLLDRDDFDQLSESAVRCAGRYHWDTTTARLESVLQQRLDEQAT